MTTANRKWECIVCGWVYDEALGAPEEGVPAGTLWEDVPEDFLCPDCGVGKDSFELIESSAASASQLEPEADSSEAENLPIVIIGTGLAGYNLAKELRKINADVSIVMITEDDGHFYSKPMLSTGFTKGADAQALIQTSVEKMREQLSAEIRVFSKLVAIDAQARQIELDDGSKLRYAKLALAWGAEAITPPIEGDGLDLVYQVNSRLDYERFCQALKEREVKKLLIIGAGLIGSEFCNDLSNGGYQIEAVDPLAHSLPTLLPEPAGKAVQEALSSLGARFHFGPVVSRIDKSTSGLLATLSDGCQIEADLALCAVGVRPRVALAKESGLEVKRGIVVNRLLETSEPDIYALGDCAEVDGLVLFYVAPLMACARALAKTLLGQSTEVNYPAMPVTIKTPACPVIVAPPGNAEGSWSFREVTGEGPGQGIVAEFRAVDGRLLGFALTGDGAKEKNKLQKELPPLLN